MAKKAFVYDGTQWVDIAQSTTDLTNYAYLPSFNFGMRNKIINGDFRINQRGYTSGSNLDSGAYGFDRWKSDYTDTTLTFTSAPQGQTVTINVGGSVSQIIERANMPAGTYVLSWTGTAIGSVFNSGATAPVGVLSPLVVTLDGSADVVVQFGPAGAGTATLQNVQLEAGSVPSSFENRPIGTELALCQRYHYRVTPTVDAQWLSNFGTARSTTEVVVPVPLPVTMREIPTYAGSQLAVSDTFNTRITATTGVINSAQPNVAGISLGVTGAIQYRPYVLINVSGQIGTSFMAFDAEL